ncbi:MAG: nucleotidyltransferase domain-containing protein, partial [Bacilli bacterium]|nr:nucleotidyltransferase domain-containing protein [Bacilli bacterium]
MYQFRVKKSDYELINKLDSVSNKNGYIRNLILEDINSGILTIKQIKERIKPVMAKHNIKEVYLFGSYSRGEATRNSDVDIYCDNGDINSLYDEVGLVEELENAL